MPEDRSAQNRSFSERRVVHRDGFLARLNAFETIVLAAILLVALAGVLLLGKGFYLKTTAEMMMRPADTVSDHQKQAPIEGPQGSVRRLAKA